LLARSLARLLTIAPVYHLALVFFRTGTFSDQLARAKWFAPQERHLPGVRFPPRRYTDNLYGFGWEAFFDANMLLADGEAEGEAKSGGGGPLLSRVFGCGHTDYSHFQHDMTTRNALILQDRVTPDRSDVVYSYKALYFGLCEWIVRKHARVADPATGRPVAIRRAPTYGEWYPRVRGLLPPTTNFFADLAAHDESSWEYNTVAAIANKQQKFVADMVKFSEEAGNAGDAALKDRILNDTRRVALGVLRQPGMFGRRGRAAAERYRWLWDDAWPDAMALIASDTGGSRFDDGAGAGGHSGHTKNLVDGATWKNLAVTYLELSPASGGGLQARWVALGAFQALTEYTRSPEFQVDYQKRDVTVLYRRCGRVLRELHGMKLVASSHGA